MKQKINGRACITLRDMLMNDELAKTMKRKHITQANVFELTEGMQDLWKEGKTTTISSDCKRIYEECGFTASKCGIGWSIA